MLNLKKLSNLRVILNDSIRRSRKVALFFCLSSFVLTSACTDYVQQIDSQYVEWRFARMTDSRDGRTYKIVTIGSQTWLAENLNYEITNSYCYNNSAELCSKYGRLYSWNAATTACPVGWHLPTKAEFETLFTAVGGQSVAGQMLKSTYGWNDGMNGSDSYSFSALAAGFRDANGNFIYEGVYAYFWSSGEYASNIADYMDLYYAGDLAYLNSQSKLHALSVRCVKD